jgi:hypothetical protein
MAAQYVVAGSQPCSPSEHATQVGRVVGDNVASVGIDEGMWVGIAVGVYVSPSANSSLTMVGARVGRMEGVAVGAREEMHSIVPLS